MSSYRPSIWVASYNNFAEWSRATPERDRFGAVAKHLDHQQLGGPHPFTINAHCAYCREVRELGFDYGITANDRGKLYIGWSEAFWCHSCSMNSRMRAVWDFLDQANLPEKPEVYMPEAITPFMRQWRERYPGLEGSEFFPNSAPGSFQAVEGHGLIRHEDLTKLSFPTGSFDLIISQEVFEHVADYQRAFFECARILRPGGKLVFTVPFFPAIEHTLIRATIEPDGSITHHHPPEYHGNPMSEEGALCFQYFGWDMLDDLRHAGFKTAQAHQYWGPWQGHCGWPMFVFSATY